MSKTTILIVEDEAIVAADLAGKLGQLGYEVAGVTGEGEEAVALAGRFHPQLVLMDIQLQGPLDGIEAAEAIRRRHDVPVIYLTAHSDAATLARAKLTGPFGYILKPFEERELATQIELALYKHQTDRELRRQREWLRVTLTSIGDAVIATDAAGRISFVNPVAESLTGWKAEEALGRPLPTVFRIVNEQTGQPLEEPVARVLREGRAVALANHAALVTKDGYTVPVEDSAAPILDAAGQVIGAVLVFHDVTEKRRAEEALRASEQSLLQRTAVLEGINRIFHEALSCHAEADLGSICLAVAEEVTSSRFGFIRELTGEGRLEDIAISDPGRKACRMANPSGHRTAPTGVAVHGIYGRVLRDGKGFYTNKPALHPDSIGVPEGHPPLQAFLGVPLIHAGKTIGMLALANRAGGYRDADLEALEMLAPAIVQALLSKRAEGALCQAMETSEALNRINEALHTTLEFDEVMQRIVAEGSTSLGSESAAVALRQGNGWVVSHVHAMPSRLVGTRMDDDQEQHTLLALKSRQPVAVDDAFNDDRFNREYLRRHNVRSVLVAPLIVRDEALGVLFFNYHSVRHEFTAAEANFSLQMATVASVALANAQLFEARKAAEDEVRKINRELEQRVKDRTAEIEAQYKELEKLNATIKQMSRKTIEAMENDRKALSKEIHDGIAGTLAAIKMQLEAWLNPSAQGSPPDLMPLDKIVAHLTDAIKETRSISRQLRTRTLDDFGLEPALIEHLQHFKQFYPGIEVVSQIEITASDIPADIQTVLYRVVQEALNNVGKHSAATKVRVKLTNHQNQIWLEVADNGCGFDLRRVLFDGQSLMGYGIHSMRERVEICKGKFQLRSKPKEGTTICISIPV